MMRRQVMAVVLVAAVLVTGRPSWGKSDAAAPSYGSQAGYGTLAAFTNLVYMPFKLVYAGMGGITGTLAWVLTMGNNDVAESVWAPSLGGTYVVTPAMFRGEEEFLPSGPSHEKSDRK
jgi:hypothetical protein